MSGTIPLLAQRAVAEALARANGTSWRANGWAGENVVRSWDHPTHPYKVPLAAAVSVTDRGCGDYRVCFERTDGVLCV